MAATRDGTEKELNMTPRGVIVAWGNGRKDARDRVGQVAAQLVLEFIMQTRREDVGLQAKVGVPRGEVLGRRENLFRKPRQPAVRILRGELAFDDRFERVGKADVQTYRLIVPAVLQNDRPTFRIGLVDGRERLLGVLRTAFVCGRRCHKE